MKKRMLAIFLGVCLVVALLPGAALAANFADTEGHWSEAAVDRWSDYGVINGDENGDFNPTDNMTRAEAAQIFTNLLQLTGTADLSEYTDINADAWYVEAISACVDAGIMNGVGNNEMDPQGTITREMFFVMFARALGIPEDTSVNANFDDVDEISSWARGAVYALINAGYINGTSDTTVSPLSDINRASVAALLDQTIVEYVVDNGSVSATESGVVLVLADSVTITGSANVTVTVANDGAAVSMAGYTGTATVIAVADNVAITGAPAGTTVVAAEGTTGTTVNGQVVTPGAETVVSQPSTGGSITPTPDPDPNPNPGDDDEEEQLPPIDDDEEEQVPPVDDDEEEQVPPIDDEEEQTQPDDEEEELESGEVENSGTGTDNSETVE